MKQDNHSWSEYYVGHQHSYSNIVLHYQYLLAVLVCRPKTLLEIGCGSADHSIFLKKLLPKLKINFLDNDELILGKVKETYSDLVSGAYLADILDSAQVQSIPTFDVIISQGLMEHFNDEDFIRIIENFRGKARKYIFSIPSNNYPTKDFGNEILRSKSEVSSLLNSIPNITYSVSGYFDIGIKTKFVGLSLRKSLIEKLEYMFFSSNHILVKISY